MRVALFWASLKLHSIENKTADSTLFLVKLSSKQNKIEKKCKGSSYTILKIFSNETNIFFIAIPLKMRRENSLKLTAISRNSKQSAFCKSI
jgi:hypothetical protein